jgi:hypothetical protein
MERTAIIAIIDNDNAHIYWSKSMKKKHANKTTVFFLVQAAKSVQVRQGIEQHAV